MSDKTKETAKAEAAVSAEATTAAAKVEHQVYCGPSVRGVARQYTVYTDGLTDELEEFLTAHPLAKSLVVPLSKFAATRMHLEKSDSAESKIMRALEKELEEG